jgi:hypothetical protein
MVPMAAAPTPAPLPAETSLPFPLQQGEQVIEVRRRHWWFLWPRTLLWIAFALVPVGVVVWLMNSIDMDGTVANVLWVVILLWLVFWGVRLFLNWYQYNHDIWVVTNQRLIDSMRPTPFRKHLSTADLVNVQDIKVNKSGIVASLLNFGNVDCQTAASGERFNITGIARPEDLQFLIDKERDRERGKYS